MFDQNTVIDVAPALRALKEHYPLDNPEIWVELVGDKLHFTARLEDPERLIDPNSGWGDTASEAVKSLLERAGTGARDRKSLMESKRAELVAQKEKIDAELAKLTPPVADVDCPHTNVTAHPSGEEVCVACGEKVHTPETI